MKLLPPRLEINPENPFENDLLERKDFAESLKNLVQNIEDNLVVFVNAPWGEGKTTFCKIWEAYLLQEKKQVIYFDSYNNDHSSDPFISFSGEILAFAQQNNLAPKPVVKDFKKIAAKAGSAITEVAIKTGLKAVTLNIINDSTIESLKKVGEEIADGIANGISEAGMELIEKRIEEYASEQEVLEEFKKRLANLGKEIKEKQGFPLTIIVDELDRCRPDFALQLLERIKHLFDVENVVFLLFINQKQIEDYIRILYGCDSKNAGEYLLKFPHLSVDLPENRLDKHDNDYARLCNGFFRHYDFSKAQDNRGLLRDIIGLSLGFRPSLRQIEKVFSYLSVYYASLGKGHFTNDFLVALLAMTKVKYPDIYRKLSLGIMNYPMLQQENWVHENVKANSFMPDMQWVENLLQFCLCADQDIKNSGEIMKFQSITNQYRITREKIIPIICKDLDRYRVTAS